MASTPAGFTYTPTARKRAADGSPKSGQAATLVPAGSPSAAGLLEQALLRVAIDEGLPIALKVGAVRGANPALRAGGDGVEVARLDWLRTLCVRYPSVKFLVTVLSADRQTELCACIRPASSALAPLE